MNETKQHLEEAKSLSLGYLFTGLAILFVATLLGFLNRLEQTGVIKYSAKAWYVLMTLHGMAAFVGFAVFVCMGLSWYVLVYVMDSPIYSTGLVKAAYWIFMVGVFLLVYATLVSGFAGSWVFLYPIINYGSWDDTATSIWIVGVLLAGVAILITEFNIIMTVRKAGYNLLDALGFEAIKPKPKKGYKVPLPVVPITVNAVGMIVATIPFAVMLVFMLLEVNGLYDKGLNALLAKNVLWWFGHPVVYTLLFPVAGFLYYMTARITNAPIIGERITKLAWFSAVLIQNFIGSHHVYMDYVQILPIHLMMQLFTYTIVIPSLATLFVVIGQIIVKDFEWDISSKYLVLGIFGWLLAGSSGVLNATILANQYVHNTLWVVAHFHTMVLLNITMLIFATSYFLIRDFTGREVYNEKLATWGMWLKFIGVIGFVHMWFMQGIMGGIRRSALSTPELGLLTWLSIPFGLMILVGIWISIYVLYKTFVGETESTTKTAVTA